VSENEAVRSLKEGGVHARPVFYGSPVKAGHSLQPFFELFFGFNAADDISLRGGERFVHLHKGHAAALANHSEEMFGPILPRCKALKVALISSNCSPEGPQ
jgi:hypothetical protein